MKMVMIEKTDKKKFMEAVNRKLNVIGDSLFSVKFQRNLFYSLSGSTRRPKEINKETSTLKESYLAFIVWNDEMDFSAR